MTERWHHIHPGEFAGEEWYEYETCIDKMSGLSHEYHFQCALRSEMERVYEGEKPLGLLIMPLKQASEACWREISDLLYKALRRIDVAGRLKKENELAILFPRVTLPRIPKLLTTLEDAYTARYSKRKPKFGFALFWPNSLGTAEDFLEEARVLTDARELSKNIRKRIGQVADSALLPEEKDTLFQGFIALRGQGPDTGP
jgi:hypothetical protein